MSIRIGSNIAALQAQRSLGKADESLRSIYTRLSSGMRINSASDDAAGLSIAASLNTDSRVFGQAIRNLNDGISFLNITEGALRSVADITIRQMELAEQSANGTFSLTQRRSLDAEANALTKEFNRIVSSTRFNGINPFDRSNSGNLSLQAGYGNAGVLSKKIGDEFARTVGNGSFTVGYTDSSFGGEAQLVDMDGDGKLDLVSQYGNNTGLVTIAKGNGDGTFGTTTTFSMVNWGSRMVIGDINGDGRPDIITSNDQNTVNVFLNQGSMTFSARQTYVTEGAATGADGVFLSDVNGDGILDLISNSTANGGEFSVLINNGNGTFQSRISMNLSGVGNGRLTFGDINGDGKMDLIASGSGGDARVLLGNGNGTFGSLTTLAGNGGSLQGISLVDINNDGVLDILGSSSSAGVGRINVWLGNSNGTFGDRNDINLGVSDSTNLKVVDYDGDGLLDIVSTSFGNNRFHILKGNGDGSFNITNSYSTSSTIANIATGDVNNDGAVDILISNSSGAGVPMQLYMGDTQSIVTSQFFNLNTAESSRTALDLLREQFERINLEIGSIGSFQSRLDVALKHLATSREQFRAAESRIMDIDVAEETAVLTSTRIIQQAATSILAQASQQPALVLQLLQ